LRSRPLRRLPLSLGNSALDLSLDPRGVAAGGHGEIVMLPVEKTVALFRA
jgi:hypothetical protein